MTLFYSTCELFFFILNSRPVVVLNEKMLLLRLRSLIDTSNLVPGFQRFSLCIHMQGLNYITD